MRGDFLSLKTFPRAILSLQIAEIGGKGDDSKPECGGRIGMFNGAFHPKISGHGSCLFRAIVQLCSTMNVTIKIEDALCREARHRAVDRGLSLSGWIADLLRKELASGEGVRKGLLEALAMKEGEEVAFEIPRDGSEARDFEIPK